MIYTSYNISPAVCPSLPPLSLAVPVVWVYDSLTPTERRLDTPSCQAERLVLATPLGPGLF